MCSRIYFRTFTIFVNIKLNRREFSFYVFWTIKNDRDEMVCYGPAVQHSSELIEQPGSSIGEARSDNGWAGTRPDLIPSHEFCFCWIWIFFVLTHLVIYDNMYLKDKESKSVQIHSNLPSWSLLYISTASLENIFSTL